MLSAHSRAAKSPAFSKRTSQSSGSPSTTTRHASSDSRTSSRPLTGSFRPPGTSVPGCASRSGTGGAPPPLRRLDPDDDLAVLDEHVVAAQADVRKGDALPGRHVVLEPVPRADD